MPGAGCVCACAFAGIVHFAALAPMACFGAVESPAESALIVVHRPHRSCSASTDGGIGTSAARDLAAAIDGGVAISAKRGVVHGAAQARLRCQTPSMFAQHPAKGVWRGGPCGGRGTGVLVCRCAGVLSAGRREAGQVSQNSFGVRAGGRSLRPRAARRSISMRRQMASSGRLFGIIPNGCSISSPRASRPKMV